MAEFEKVPVKTRTGELVASYTPSPSEHAFSGLLSDRFNIALNGAILDGHLDRMSIPAVVGGKLLAFQYTRYDVLNVNSFPVLLGNEGLPSDTPDSQTELDELDTFERDFDRQEQIKQLVKTRKQETSFDPLHALTNPHYYNRELTVVRWPELFRFVVFNEGSYLEGEVKPGPIGYRGKFNGERPDIYGNLFLPLRIEDSEGKKVNAPNEGKFTVMVPRVNYQISRAYFKNSDIGLKLGRGLDYDDYGHSFTLDPKEEPKYLNDDKPQEVIGRIFGFVKELVKA